MNVKDLNLNSTSPKDLGETCNLKLFWEDLSFVNPFTFSDIPETDFKKKDFEI